MRKATSFLILGISIILLGASLFLNISNTIITNESIVLTFVGILATFIVVGNFTQVLEIRSTTDKKIAELEKQTQAKIDQLNTLFDKITQMTEKASKIEKDTLYAKAELYRLFGLYTLDSKNFKNATMHFINAITNYNNSNVTPTMLESLLDAILNNLEIVNWNSSTEDFDYQRALMQVKNFPDEYSKKSKIIEAIELNKVEDSKKTDKK